MVQPVLPRIAHLATTLGLFRTFDEKYWSIALEQYQLVAIEEGQLYTVWVG